MRFGEWYYHCKTVDKRPGNRYYQGNRVARTAREPWAGLRAGAERNARLFYFGWKILKNEVYHFIAKDRTAFYGK